MSAAVKAAVLLLKKKRVRKAIVCILVCVLFLLTAAGTSCTANNLQHYAQETVAADFSSLISDVDSKIADGGQINTELLYASYITLFDNSQYPDRESVREKLITCFYTVTEKKVQEKDSSGKPVLDAQGKPKYRTVKEVHAVSDLIGIFSNIETKFGITIDSEKQQYILNLSQLIANYGFFSPSGTVTAYDALIAQYCAQYGITQYAALVQAVMQQESGGSGNDPMQCSESSLNTEYPRQPNGITNPQYSIQIGIEYLASCLRAAKCKSPLPFRATISAAVISRGRSKKAVIRRPTRWSFRRWKPQSWDGPAMAMSTTSAMSCGIIHILQAAAVTSSTPSRPANIQSLPPSAHALTLSRGRRRITRASTWRPRPVHRYSHPQPVRSFTHSMQNTLMTVTAIWSSSSTLLP